MEFTKLVEERRSIRAFKAGMEVKKSDLEEMIKCAIEAPTWKNSQTGRYYVVSSSDMMDKIRSEALPEFNQNSSANAGALIITAFEKTRSGFERDGQPANELGDEWGAYDLGLANELLILKVRELGLDTLIMGIRNSDKLRELLAIPETQEVVAVIAVGCREADPQRPKRKDVKDVAVFF